MKHFGQLTICVLLLAISSYAGDSADRKVLYREEVPYPAIAAQNNLHGTVKLKIWIRADGTIRRLEYIGGHPLLAESALKAVKNWKYQVATSESTAQVEIKF